MAMTSTKAIKTFFEKGGDRKVTMTEMTDLKKAISDDEYAELGQLACVELGEEWDPPKPK